MKQLLTTVALIAGLFISPVLEAAPFFVCKIKGSVHVSSCCAKKNATSTTIQSNNKSCCNVLGFDSLSQDLNLQPTPEETRPLVMVSFLEELEQAPSFSAPLLSSKQAQAPPNIQKPTPSSLCRFLI